MFRKIIGGLAITAILSGCCSLAAADAGGDEARRQEAIAEFTRKTKAANYPALFEQAAAEFNVPADVLKGIAFAETRWEHLTWPPGETVSPENGMPRPFGIMSLWDNQYFGHTLVEAATLIKQDPEVLKADPLQNIRGAAALLRKIYDENPKPPGTTDGDIESWRYAIRKYCGIPEPDLNAQHALNVYVFMSQGYHQYGIEWNSVPVNLEPIRQETARIVAEEKSRRGVSAPPTAPARFSNDLLAVSQAALPNRTPMQHRPDGAAGSSSVKSTRGSVWFVCGLAVLLVLFLIVFKGKRSD